MAKNATCIFFNHLIKKKTKNPIKFLLTNSSGSFIKKHFFESVYNVLKQCNDVVTNPRAISLKFRNISLSC